MKKILFIIILLQQWTSLSQNSPCVNNVSTDPNSPFNSNLPIDTLTGVVYDSLFLNDFDWIPFNSFGNFADLETIGIQHLGTDQYMFSLFNPTINPNTQYYQYLKDEVIMPSPTDLGFIPSHQNGWELLAVNLGFFPDGTPYSDLTGVSNQHPRIPYVILYHRYLSKIRIFANIGDEWALNHAYDAVRIRLSLNRGSQFDLNGLFRL